jgi:16S rRNA (cytosine967-C5)-methyltransferase
VAACLAGGAPITVRPITAGEFGLPPDVVTADGHLRTLPHHALGPDAAMAGMDGFFAARLTRTA